MRLVDALMRGDISAVGFQIVAFLAAVCWRNDGFAIYRVDHLQRVLGFTKSRDTFIRELKRLRPEWVDFELRERQRKPVTFTLTGGAVRTRRPVPPVGVSAAKEGKPAQQSSGAVRQTRERPSALGVSHSAQPGLEGHGSPTSFRGDQTTPEETTAEGVCCDDCQAKDDLAEYGRLVLCGRCFANRNRVRAALDREGRV
jgi:hypothetical protein